MSIIVKYISDTVATIQKHFTRTLTALQRYFNGTSIVVQWHYTNNITYKVDNFAPRFQFEALSFISSNFSRCIQ